MEANERLGNHEREVGGGDKESGSDLAALVPKKQVGRKETSTHCSKLPKAVHRQCLSRLRFMLPGCPETRVATFTQAVHFLSRA